MTWPSPSTMKMPSRMTFLLAQDIQHKEAACREIRHAGPPGRAAKFVPRIRQERAANSAWRASRDRQLCDSSVPETQALPLLYCSPMATSARRPNASGLLSRLCSLIPSGGSLPESVWRARHRFLVGLTFFHVVIIALTGPVLGKHWELSFRALLDDDSAVHVLGEALVVALFGVLACWRPAGRTLQATFVGFGLMSSSAMLIHLPGGYIELHFHFFV